MDWAESLGFDEDHIQDLRSIGYAYAKEGLYDTAISVFEALCIFVKTEPYDFQTLGALYLEKGNFLKALEMCDAALNLDPSHTATSLNKAKALLSLGYKNEAKKLLRQITSIASPPIQGQATALLTTYFGLV